MSEQNDSPFEAVTDDNLEARIVAWVLGGASECEAGLLRALCREKPELAMFRRRIEEAHGLLAESMEGPAAERKVPPEGGGKVLEVGGVRAGLSRRARSVRGAARRVILAAAACLVLALLVAGLLVPAGLKAGKKSVQSPPQPNPQLELDRVEKEMEGIERALREQEERVEEKRKVLNTIVETKGIVYRGGDDLRKARMEASVKTGIDTYDFAEARREYEDARQLHDRMRLDLQGRKIALDVKKAELTEGTARGSGEVTDVGFSRDARLQVKPGVVIGGYVRKPGPVPLPEGLTLGEALESANGANEFAATNRLEVFRGGKRRVLDLRTEEGRAFRLESGDQVNVPQKNWLGDGGGPEHPDPSQTADRSGAQGGKGAAKKPAADRRLGQNDAARSRSAVKRLNERLEGEKLIANRDAVPVTASAHDTHDYVEAREGFEQAREMYDQMRIKYQRERIQLELPRSPVMYDQAIDLMAEMSAMDEPFSTFSLHVSDSSFRVAAAALERGERPEPESVRAEEFYNAFDYGDPSPTEGEPVACAIEQCAHPLLPGRNLVRIGVCTAAAGRGAGQALRLTVLLDSSGSMEREDRRAAVRAAMEQLASLLGPQDVVTVAGFARQPHLLADRMSGEQARTELVALIDRTPAEGGTNLEQALALASELALRQFDGAAQNRIVLLTDGAANLGNADPEQLARRVDGLRQRGISFDAAGFGIAGMNDRMLERLTRDGNGRYYVVDRPEDAGRQFAERLAGAFRPAAENVKVQVRFNPARVGGYRLVGFEEHRLKKEDFRDDTVDAAELAAEEAGVAVYQVELLPQGEGEIGEVSIRFRDVAGGRMVERSWTMPHAPSVPAFDRAAASMQVAGIALLAADALRDGPLAPLTDWSDLAPVSSGLRAAFGGSARVGQLLKMVERLR